MADEHTIVTPQAMAIVASVVSLISLVISSIHCVFACKNPDCNFKLRFGSTVATDTTTQRDNDTTTAMTQG